MTPSILKTAPLSTYDSAFVKKTLVFGPPAVFFAFFFFFLLLRIDPPVIYSCNGFDLHSYVTYTRALSSADAAYPVHEPPLHALYILELTREYFSGIFSVPGGFTRLVVTAFIYTCHFPVTGALAMTGFAVLLFFLSHSYAGRCRAPLPLILRLGPPVFVLCMCQWYDFTSMAYCVPAAAALLAAVCCQTLPLKTTAGRISVTIAFFWMSYCLFQWACLLFFLLVCIDLAFRARRALFPFVIIMVLNCVMVFLAELNLIPPENSFLNELHAAPAALPIAITMYFPLITILCGPAFSGLLTKMPLPHLRRTTAAPLSVLIAASAVLYLSGIPTTREIRIVGRTLHHLQNNRWDKILSENTSALFNTPSAADSPLALFVTHATNYALSKTGQLGSKMFSYPQLFFSPEPLLLIQNTLLYGFVNWVSALDVFMDLGMLSHAEKTAGETMENMGPYPFLMYRRAILQLAKGNKDAAVVYLNKLSGMPFYRTEARQLLAMPGDGAADPRIAPLRANRDTSDYFLFRINEEGILLHLLKSNPLNKMAYDYLMTLYLLTGQVEKLAVHAARSADFGYYRLPRHWDEALCIYLSQDPALKDGKHGLSVRPETIARFDSFLQAYAPYEDDPSLQAMAASKLEKAFGATYYFFYNFQFSPGTRK